MSAIKLISPMLDNFVMGDPICDHNGIRCCPAMMKDSDDKFIVKIISVPPSQTQLDALLLSGAYPDAASALDYFKSLTDDILEEVKILKKLAASEGYLSIDACQVDVAEDASGFDVYLLSTYRRTLQRQLRHGCLTHLSALNLGLDLCAALAAARRMGYLYVDLKPGNIYLSGSHEYRIGDIGFINLASLKYASLPERYRSEYTAPEITDAYSSLNATIDVYALGLILYQVFNDGILPLRNDSEAFPAPAYADYEIAEIILKACALNPSDRWQDPVEFGQALVNYMQRNGVHDTPITPVPESVAADVVDAETDTGETEGAYVKEETVQEPTDINCEEEAESETTTEVSQEAVSEPELSAEDIPEDTIYTEDAEGNLTFIEGEDDETMGETDAAAIDYEEVSPEVSGMLQQADDLIEHDAPGPVVQPEPIDVPLPPPIVIEEPSETNAEPAVSDTGSDADIEAAGEPEEAEADTEGAPETEEITEASVTETDTDITSGKAEKDYAELDPDVQPKKHRGKWIAGTIITLLVAALLVAGFFFVKNYYLQTVDAITLVPGGVGELTVKVLSNADESELIVVCTDTYGIQHTSELKDGKAFFEGLAPNSAYTITVTTNGFHYLLGNTTASYTTPNTTEIIQFTAVTGPEDGSVILSFTISGPDSDTWQVAYTADDGTKECVVFAGHMVTITGLTPEKEYSFTLTPEAKLDMTGIDTVLHTAKAIIKAEKLAATSCVGDTLTAKWTVQDDISVSSWTVHCYNDTYDETVVVTETEVSFTIPDDKASYTIDVSASGMSVSERVYIDKNSLTVTDFTVDNVDNEDILIFWSPVEGIPEDGWILLYSTDGSAAKQIACTDNKAAVSPVIPGCLYQFILQTADGQTVLGGTLEYTTEEVADFEGYKVTSEDMEFKMCRTPSNSNWDRYDLSKSDYTTEFTVGEKASFLVRLKRSYSTSNDSIETLFVIRDEAGTVISAETYSNTWTKMWYKNYCELDIPNIPQTPGNYTISIYFNSAFAYEGTFTVTD